MEYCFVVKKLMISLKIRVLVHKLIKKKNSSMNIDCLVSKRFVFNQNQS